MHMPCQSREIGRPLDSPRPARSPVSMHRLCVISSLLLAGQSLWGGCATNHSPGVPTRASAAPAAARPTTPAVRSTVAERPVAMIEDDPVTLSDLKGRMVEQSGAETLRELRLEAALRKELQQRSMRITTADTEAEQNRLLERFSDDRDTALMVLQTLRRNEGLGPKRYEALLWRNAALRKLVDDEIDVDPETVQRLYRLEHGRRHVIRIHVVPTLQEAQEHLERTQRGESFADIATAHSMDSSRDRGGLMEAFSLEDPAWPQALRTELEPLNPGDLTGIVFLEDRYAIARVERIVAADGVEFETVRGDLERSARLSQERLKMAELAGRLGERPRIRILDPDLRRAWSVDESAAEDR